METLTVSDLNFILESLEHTRHKFENYPIGEKGYPSHEYKQNRIEDANAVISKVQKLRDSMK